MRLSRRALLGSGALALWSGCARPRASQAPAPTLTVLSHRPGSREYEALRGGFNKAYHRITPQLIALPRSDQEVAQVMDFCRERGLRLHLRAGGHSFEDLNTGPDVLLDLRQLNQLRFDPERQRLTVGAGAKLGAVVAALAPHGLAIPTGSCPSVGVTGLTLGGGYGFLSRKFGLTCDALVEAKLLDADARLHTASSRESPELFWALRGGGGGNFGVVTELTFQAQPVPPKVTVLHARVRALARLEFLRRWQAWIPTGPDDLSPLIYLAATPKGIDGPVVLAQHCGDAESARRALEPLAPFFEAMEPEELSLREAVEYFGGALDAPLVPVQFKAKSHFFKRALSDVEWGALLSRLEAPLDGVLGLMLDPWRGAIARISHAETAFAHRDALFSVQYRADFSTEAEERACRERLGEVYAAMTPMSNGAYLNYCDKELAQPERHYHGAHLPRLRALKRRFDPKGVFRHALSL